MHASEVLKMGELNQSQDSKAQSMHSVTQKACTTATWPRSCQEVGSGGGFFFACEDFEGMFDNLFPA